MQTMTQTAFAKAVDVSVPSVNVAIKKGRLPSDGTRVVIEDGVSPKDLWDATASDSPNHQANKARLDALKAGQDAIPDGSATQLVKLASALKLETYKLQKAKAELANIELDKAAGALVERDAVDLVLADLGATIRSIIEQLPTRLYAVHAGDHQKIMDVEAVAVAMLIEIGDVIMRKSEKI